MHAAMVCIKTDRAHHVRSEAVRIEAPPAGHSDAFKRGLVELSMVPRASVATIALGRGLRTHLAGIFQPLRR